MLRFLLESSKEIAKNIDEDKFSSFSSSDFEIALEKGYAEGIAEMIRISGGELPLDSFVKQSGVEDAEKPKYYQGLSIGGKKMKKWAQQRAAGSRRYNTAMEDSTPPLLQAAHQAGLAATEWFLSDTPARLYKEFGSNNSNDKRLKMLANAPGGFDQVVDSWLGRRSKSFIFNKHPSPTGGRKSLLVLGCASLTKKTGNGFHP